MPQNKNIVAGQFQRMKAEPSLNVTKFMPSNKNIIAGMLVSFRE